MRCWRVFRLQTGIASPRMCNVNLRSLTSHCGRKVAPIDLRTAIRCDGLDAIRALVAAALVFIATNAGAQESRLASPTVVEQFTLPLSGKQRLTIRHLVNGESEHSLQVAFPNGKTQQIPWNDVETTGAEAKSWLSTRRLNGEWFLWVPREDLSSRNPQHMSYRLDLASGVVHKDRVWTSPSIDVTTDCVHEYSQAGHAGAIATRSITCRRNGNWETWFERKQDVAKYVPKDDDCRVIYSVTQRDFHIQPSRAIRFNTCDPMQDRLPLWVQRAWDRSLRR